MPYVYTNSRKMNTIRMLIRSRQGCEKEGFNKKRHVVHL